MLQMMENSNLTSLEGVGKGIQFPWLGVLFGSIPVSKSLGTQRGQGDLFLNSNQQVSKQVIMI